MPPARGLSGWCPTDAVLLQCMPIPLVSAERASRGSNFIGRPSCNQTRSAKEKGEQIGSTDQDDRAGNTPVVEQETTGHAGDEDAERPAQARKTNHRTAHILRCFLAQQSGDRQDHAHLSHADQHTTQIAEWRKGLLLQAEQRVTDSTEQQGGPPRRRVDASDPRGSRPPVPIPALSPGSGQTSGPLSPVLRGPSSPSSRPTRCSQRETKVATSVRSGTRNE
jgi:hypothetical protein